MVGLIEDVAHMYENNFTKVNPGLIIIMVDQSRPMFMSDTDGKALAEQTAMVINSCIAEMGLRFSSGTAIKNSASIVLIGYGGEPSYDATIIKSGTIVDFIEKPIRVETSQKSIQFEGEEFVIDTEIPINLEAVTGYSFTPMLPALELAKAVINQWVFRGNKSEIWEEGYRDVNRDPAPRIINFSHNVPTDSSGIVLEDFSSIYNIIECIKSIPCPDGPPLFFNVNLLFGSHLSSLTEHEQKNIRVLNDLLNNISSHLTEEMITAGCIVRDINKCFIASANEDEINHFCTLATNNLCYAPGPAAFR